jgi:hypothetical protein
MGDLGKALPYGARRIRHGPWRDSHKAASFPVRCQVGHDADDSQPVDVLKDICGAAVSPDAR